MEIEKLFISMVIMAILPMLAAFACVGISFSVLASAVFKLFDARITGQEEQMEAEERLERVLRAVVQAGSTAYAVLVLGVGAIIPVGYYLASTPVHHHKPILPPTVIWFLGIFLAIFFISGSLWLMYRVNRRYEEARLKIPYWLKREGV